MTNAACAECSSDGDDSAVVVRSTTATVKRPKTRCQSKKLSFWSVGHARREPREPRRGAAGDSDAGRRERGGSASVGEVGEAAGGEGGSVKATSLARRPVADRLAVVRWEGVAAVVRRGPGTSRRPAMLLAPRGRHTAKAAQVWVGRKRAMVGGRVATEGTVR